MKVYIETLGCQMNAADSEEMAEAFLQRGVTLTEKKFRSDVIILNTCTVRDHAEQKALSYVGRLKDWKRENPERVLIVAGCAAERTKTTLKKRFPHIDLVVGAKAIEDFPGIIEKFFKNRKNGLNEPQKSKSYDWFTESEDSFDGSESRASGEPLVLGTQGESAFVTIMRGCNYSCSYCIVPSVRGRERYRDPQAILAEIKRKVAAGASKVMLLGQTVNSYWHKEAGSKITDFSDLLIQADAIPGVQEIKFMSPHPHYLSDKLIQILGELKSISPQMHFPVQSGSNRILKAMKRNYTREEFIEKAGALRKAVPGLQLSTDFIVGFPGETKEDFEETLSLAKALNLGQAYCFKYSPRGGTESSCFVDDVPRKEKEERLARLLATVESKKKKREKVPA